LVLPDEMGDPRIDRVGLGEDAGGPAHIAAPEWPAPR
jgi:hypothetical protein